MVVKRQFIEINSWLLTIIFVIATIIPSFIQKFFIKDIQNKSAIWEKQNAEYTQATVDAINGSKTAMLYDAQIPVILMSLSRRNKWKMH